MSVFWRNSSTLVMGGDRFLTECRALRTINMCMTVSRMNDSTDHALGNIRFQGARSCFWHSHCTYVQMAALKVWSNSICVKCQRK